MYAVIESGGKQYRVELGSEIQVDRLDVEPGDPITLDRVLLVADGEATAIGRPLVEGAVVSALVVRQERGDKVVVFKYKPKARTRVKQGARADLTRLRIADIAFGGRSAAAESQRSESQKQRAERDAEKDADRKAEADKALAAKLAADAEAAAADARAVQAAAPAEAEPTADVADPGTSTEAVATPDEANAVAEAAETETRKDD